METPPVPVISSSAPLLPTFSLVNKNLINEELNKHPKESDFIKYFYEKKLSEKFSVPQLIIINPTDEDIQQIKIRKEMSCPDMSNKVYSQTKGILEEKYCTNDLKKNIIDILQKEKELLKEKELEEELKEELEEDVKINILEVFAGNGVSSSNLFDKITDLTIKKTDPFSYKNIEQIEPIGAVKKYTDANTLLMIFPPSLHDKYCIESLESFYNNEKSKFLIICGDINGINDGSKNLYDYLFNIGKWKLKLYHEILEHPNIILSDNSIINIPAICIFEKIYLRKTVKEDDFTIPSIITTGICERCVKKSNGCNKCKITGYMKKSGRRLDGRRKYSKRKSVKRKSVKRKSRRKY